MKGLIKCVVWDLDNTLWDGVLLEDEEVILRDEVVALIKSLDEKGILHSIASRNDEERVWARLETTGLSDYFLFPQIGFGSKAAGVRSIAEALNIGLDSVVFVDDEPFERDEVRFSVPEVRCFDGASVEELRRELIASVSARASSAAGRRHLYRTEMVRRAAEDEFEGTPHEFLATLGMKLTIFPADEAHLQRAEELTRRTNQLNTTGQTFALDELRSLCHSEDFELILARLEDCYGTYGTIGLALVECGGPVWNLKLFLMSCRVMSRGVGSVFLSHVMHLAKKAGSRLQAEFLPNGRNRMMDVTYRFAGFRPIDQRDTLQIFEHDLAEIPPVPAYVDVHSTVGKT